MDTGMLWFDNDPRTALAAKIGRAADYYRHKYNLSPNICLVNPSMLGDQVIAAEGAGSKVVVRAHRAIQPGHLWIGKED
jgi:hypothetical protein